MGNHGKPRGISYVLMVGGLLLSNVRGYKSHQKYNPYKYDLGNVMFTPDGRLLQVEYATTAATAYSAPICLVRLTDDLILMACPVKKTSAQGAVSVMDRLIVLPQATASANDYYDDDRSTTANPSSTSNTVDAVDGNRATTLPVVLVAIAGVLADGLSLLQKLQDDLLQDVRYFGGRHQPTPLYVAEKLTDYFQTHCLQGGVRPYGAMVWTIGFNGSGIAGRHILEIFQTSPSGGLVQLHLPENKAIPLILGEGGIDGQDLVRQLKKTLSTGDATRDPVMSTIGRVAKLLISSAGTEPEVLLLSSSRGALKLTKGQIQSYVKQFG